MAILPRYLLRQYLPVFLLCAGLCTGVLLMHQFIRLFNLAVLKGISPVWILACFARLLPYFVSLAVPIAFLVALLMCLGALSESGEVMALRSSGFSFRDILWPFFAFAVALSALLVYVNHKASPEGYHSFKNSYEAALAQVSNMDLDPGTFTALGDWKIYAKRVERGTGHLGEVYLVKLKGAHAGLRVEAPEGELRLKAGADFSVTLRRGKLYLPGSRPAKLLAASFGEYRLSVPLAGYRVQGRAPDLQEINTFRLREHLRDPSVDDAHRKEYRTEEAVRTVGALTPCVFFWLGCPLGLRLAKHAKATGFALSLLLLLVYYGLLAVGVGLGRRHGALSGAAPWLPVASGLAAGGWFWRRNLRV